MWAIYANAHNNSTCLSLTASHCIKHGVFPDLGQNSCESTAFVCGQISGLSAMSQIEKHGNLPSCHPAVINTLYAADELFITPAYYASNGRAN